MGPVKSIGENSGRGTHRVSEKNHGEEGVEDGGSDVGDTDGVGSLVRGGNIVGGYLHWPYRGDSDSVGDAAANL